MLTTIRLRLVAIFGVLVLVLAACSVGLADVAGDSDDTPDAAPATSDDDTARASSDDDTTQASTDHEQHAQAADLDAEELRITLERLLAQHTQLAIEAMRAGLTGEAYFEDAAASLDRNTEALTGAIELVYGSDGAEVFNDLWNDHIGFFVDYTVGLAEGDEEAQQQALDNLAQYRDDFSSFLETATDGEIDAETAAGALQMHVDQLIAQIDAYHAEDYTQAFEIHREGFAHMFVTAQALAGAIVGQMPDTFPGQLDSEPVELRSALGQLLSEHAALAIEAMRKGLDGDPDFEAAAGALDGNTDDLTDAIAGIFGSEGAEVFNQLWNDHIGFFVDYTVGLAEGDEEAQQQALDNLAQYRDDFSSFLETATDGELEADAAAGALQAHIDDLVAQIDEWHAAGNPDFDDAFRTSEDAFDHMFVTAAALSDAIVAFMADEMPEGGAPTGGGGTADDS